MKNSFGIVILFCFLLPNILSAQNENQPGFEELALELSQQQEDDIGYDDVYESLIQLYSDPINLNKAIKEDLQQLYILSPLQINNFLEYRNQEGELLSIYELQTIPEWDYITIQKILPFVAVVPNGINVKSLFKDFITNDNHYMLIRYGRTPETISEQSSYMGDQNRWYLRYRNSKSKEYSYGITMKKDAGEKIQWSPSKKYYASDFLSYHVTLFNHGKFKAITLGDYQLQFGQGLVMSSGFRLGKGSETILTVKQNNAGIRPYSSSMEYGFLRGTAFCIKAGLTDFTFFYSKKKIDGSIKEDNTFSPIYSGYHRTEQELLKRETINEQIIGGNVSLNQSLKNFHAGFTFVNSHYDYFLKKSPAVYNSFDFSGKNNYTMGIDANYTYQNFVFFGETAISKSSGKAIVAGIISNLSKHLELSMLYRNYERDFHSFFGNAFGENSENKNESGLYWGLKFKPLHKLTFSCYYDRFKFPWLKYLVDAPSKGDEYLGRISYQPSKTMILYTQFKQESKEKNLPDNEGKIDYPENAVKRNVMFNVEVKASENLTSKTRIQASSYHQANNKTYGYAIINDLDIKIHPFYWSFRFALFETDDYENRQYAYERDVQYYFSIPAYYGKGTRSNVLLRLKTFKNTDIWIRYARTNYTNKDLLNSSVHSPSTSSDVKIQIRYIFN